MVKIAVPKEMNPKETRVALIPASVKQLVAKGFEVVIQKEAGVLSGYPDSEYEKAGASLSEDRKAMIAAADLVARVRKPETDEIGWMKAGSLHVSYLDPFNEEALVQGFLKQKVDAVSMELIPRTTLAQKMDALSSQASLAGYVAVIIAAERLNKIFPMMMTPAGTIAPSRVFIIGAGVAGLQAIATAKRLGARVDAFDTRPVVEEQVQSLGAKFVKIDLGDTGQTKDGYAKALTEEQLKIQRDAMAKLCAQSDVVITTAQVFGRKAPVIVTKEMVAGMKPGSILVDLAVESGGNVEGARAGEEVNVNGVSIIGLENLPGRVATHASQMYSSNITNFLLHFWKEADKNLDLNPEDEIIRGCLVTRGGEIFSETYKNITK
jgi:NAD(P) transhydrogenase subunit alpha